MTAPRHPLGHVRDTVLDLPEYDLKILLNGYPAHSVRCRRGWAHRDRIRQPDYDPSDRVRNECLDVVCDCGTDGRYAQYLEDQLTALRAQLEASQVEAQGMRAALDGHAGTHSPYLWTGPAEHHSAWLNGQQAVQKYGADRYQMGFEKAQEIAAVTGETQILYAEAAEYRDPAKEVTLVGRVFPDGVRIGCQALEPWYGTGVLIPPSHPAYLPAQRFLAALAQAGAGDQA